MAEEPRVSEGAAPSTPADGGAVAEHEHSELEQCLHDDASLRDDPPREAIATTGASSQQGPVFACTAGTSAASSTVAVVDPGRTMLAEILALKEEQKRVRDDRKEVTKKLRNAERRRRRLKARANRLSDSDLLAVISLRNYEKAQGGRGIIEEEEDDESDSEQEAEPARAATSASSTAPRAATPKKRARGS